MADYKHSNEARADLRRIAKFGIENFGERQARAYLLMFEAMYPTLGETPNPGLVTHIPRRKRPLWRVPVGAHVVYYRRVRGYMFIVRILGKRELPELHL